MPTLLKPDEYNASYFDGNTQPMRHNAGYSRYERWYRTEGENSLGEYWKDYAKRLFDTYELAGKKVLEIGCAKGFVVEDLRSFGVDAYGLDVSSYAVSQASEAVKPFLSVGDARTALSQYKANEFDVAFSLRVLECFTDTEAAQVVGELNRIARFQFHVIDEFTDGKVATYYNAKPLEQWHAMAFRKGTKLISQENTSRILTK